MAADSAVDQRHANSLARVAGLPCGICVDRGRGIAQVRRQHAIQADVCDIRLVRKAHDAVAIEQRNYTIDQRHLCYDSAPKFHNIVYQAPYKAQ